MSKKLIRFDWAMKKLLRYTDNYAILEGFLSELLLFDVTIESILESEGNKQDEYDKYNRVDILVKSQSNELMLVEVQNDSEVDYFHRMLYGVSKLVTEYIKEGEPYGTIKKIYSIHLVYLALLLIFNALFWNEMLGLNLFIFSNLLIGSFLFFYKETFKSKNVRIAILFTFITGVTVLIHNSIISKIAHITSFWLNLFFL